MVPIRSLVLFLKSSAISFGRKLHPIHGTRKMETSVTEKKSNLIKLKVCHKDLRKQIWLPPRVPILHGPFSEIQCDKFLPQITPHSLVTERSKIPTYASVHTKHLLPAHSSQLVQCARTVRRIRFLWLSFVDGRNPKGGCTPAWYNIRRYLSLLRQAATHNSKQLHAVAKRLFISFSDNNWVCSPVSETPWLESAVEVMYLWQSSVSSQCVRMTMIVVNIPRVSPSSSLLNIRRN